MGRGRGRGKATPPSRTSSRTRTRSATVAVDEDPIEDVAAEESEESVTASGEPSSLIIPFEGEEEEVERGGGRGGRRGRKRKATTNDTPHVDVPASPDSKRGNTELQCNCKQGTNVPLSKQGNLRRRDTLKASSRYSPPPVVTRTRGSNRMFPSTGQSRYVIDADAADSSTTLTPSSAKSSETVATGASRRKSLGVRNTGSVSVVSNSTVTENLEAKTEGDQIVVQLPDGTQKNVCLF